MLKKPALNTVSYIWLGMKNVLSIYLKRKKISEGVKHDSHQSLMFHRTACISEI